MAFLCVDIGGTNTLVGVGNGDFEIVKKVKSKDFLEDIGSCLEDVINPEKMEKIDRVAVAAAGPVDRQKGTFYPPNLPMDEVKIRDPLETFGEVDIVNDCAAAVLGEYHYGEHDTENLVYITISSGIGAGAVIDGKLIEAEDGNFGEIGHMIVGDDGMECGCGLEDHWEAYCSGNSLPALAEEITGESFQDARTLFEEYQNGNRSAEDTIDRMQDINARAAANVVNMYNPGKLVFGGAVALNHPETVVEPLDRDLGDITVNGKPEVEVCELEEEAVLHWLRAVCNGEK